MSASETLLSPSATSRFSPAAGTPAGTAVHTDSLGLVAGPTTVPSQGADMPAYMARPAGHHDRLPMIIVVQEIFGVHEYIQDLCRRLAKQGYLAIAPELYFRQGDASQYQEISDLFAQLVSKVPDSQVMSDLDHTAHWAASNGGDSQRLGITGFCWGGRISWLYAAHNPQIKAAVAWYGKLNGDRSINNPKHPVDVANDLSAPVLGLYGAQDSSIGADQIDSMRQAIRAANTQAEIVVYPHAGHAFHADYRPSYHASSAEDGWQRMLTWFERFGVK